MKPRLLALVLAMAGCDSAKPAEAPPPPPPPPPPAAAEAESDGTELEEPTDEAETLEGGDKTDKVEHARDTLRHDIDDKRRELDESALAIDRRRAELEILETELDKRLAGVTTLEGRLEQQLGIGKVARQRRDERISALAALISTMPPQAGAEIVAKMTDEDAQWLLLAIARTSDRKAAKLMSLMPADRAAQLGQIYLNTDPASLSADDAPRAEAQPGDAAPPTPAPAAGTEAPAGAAPATPAGPALQAQGPAATEPPPVPAPPPAPAPEKP